MAEPQEEMSMERRFVLFIVMAVGLLWLFNVWNARNAPPNRQVAKPAAEEKDEPAARAAQQPAPEEPADEQGELPVDPPAELQFVTLGSADYASNSRMLVTLTNVGGGVRRVELASPQFRDLHDRSGYLGHLALEDDPKGGARARIVGAGTPAHKSGLSPGDVITAIKLPGERAPTPIAKSSEFNAALASTEPRQEVQLTIRRDGETKVLDPTKLTRRPLEVIRPEAENILLYAKQLPPGYVDHPSFVVQLESVDDQKAKDPLVKAANVELATGNWHVEAVAADSATMRMRLPNLGLEIFKHYRVDTVPAGEHENQNYPAYDFKLDVEVRNLNGQPRKIVYGLRGPNGLPIEGWWYATKVSRGWSAAGLRDVLTRFPNKGKVLEDTASNIADGDGEIRQGFDPNGNPMGMAYAGVDAQYFASMILPLVDDFAEESFTEVRPIVVGEQPAERWPRTYTNVSVLLVRKPLELDPAGQPGDKTIDKLQVFNGPKRPALLAQYQAAADASYSLADIITYGWFTWIAKAMLGILHFFYSFVRNYGIAIIMLTVLVRGMMFPLSRKQALNMAKMQELKPEMDRIAEKYKGDVEKRTKAQQELFRKHNYNPMGGCLMMFLQLPIFIGLYRSLVVDVELRDAPLFSHAIRWCSNLAAPDMLYDWSWFMPQMINSGNGMFALGPYLNILPLVTVALFLVQQKMFMPPPTNEQARMQMKIMQYMMIFMAVLFYKVAAGLCIYFIASSLWGMAERKLLPKFTPPADTSTGSSGTAGNGAKLPPPSGPRPTESRNGASKTARDKKARAKAKRRK